VFPDEFLTLLDDLGIDPAKPAEICDWPCDDESRGLYGWFHFVGVIAAHPVVDPHEWQSVDPAIASLLEGPPIPATALLDRRGLPFSVGFRKRADLAPAPFEGLQVTQLEFDGSIPWVLAEPQPRE
jgi:hypothetical protein